MPRVPRGVWVLGFVSLFMDVSSELIHSLLPVFMVTSLGASALMVGIVEILLAFWVAGSFKNKVILLVAYVGIIALSRGITEIFFAFKLKGLRRRPAVA